MGSSRTRRCVVVLRTHNLIVMKISRARKKERKPGTRDADVSRANDVFVDPIPRENKDLNFSKKRKQKRVAQRDIYGNDEKASTEGLHGHDGDMGVG